RSSVFSFFFFQAEDGIRDFHVTGVQTCALPIFAPAVERVLAGIAGHLVGAGGTTRLLVAGGETSGAVIQALGVALLRIGPEIAPGICWSGARTATGAEIALALKSGNFGVPELFDTAWEQLS